MSYTEEVGKKLNALLVNIKKNIIIINKGDDEKVKNYIVTNNLLVLIQTHIHYR
jgi:hypothetical protein